MTETTETTEPRRSDAMAPDEVERLLEESGALARGHFRLSSGRHSPAYVQCALLLEEPRRGRRVGRALARTVASLRPASVVAPAMGGLLVGYEVAAALGVPFRFVERPSGGGGRAESGMELRRGFRLAPGERVVVVEDVVTTGRSTHEAMEAIARGGAETVAVVSIIDRSGGEKLFDVPHLALLALELPTYGPQECPLCAEGSEPTKPGSRPSSGSQARG